jgi:hypothetical protein
MSAATNVTIRCWCYSQPNHEDADRRKHTGGGYSPALTGEAVSARALERAKKQGAELNRVSVLR